MKLSEVISVSERVSFFLGLPISQNTHLSSWQQLETIVAQGLRWQLQIKQEEV